MHLQQLIACNSSQMRAAAPGYTCEKYLPTGTSIGTNCSRSSVVMQLHLIEHDEAAGNRNN
jgi:hypothetical protein